jgi:Ca2+-binding RTX toxin-like protein
MKKFGKFGAKRLAMATAVFLALGTLVATPALAVECTVAAPVTFGMSGTTLTGAEGAGCVGVVDTVTVTGTGLVTFNLGPTDFINSEGVEIEFVIDSTSTTIEINGTDGKDEIDMDHNGIDLNDAGSEEIVTQTDTANFQTTSGSGLQSVTVNLGGGNDVFFASGVGADFPLPLLINGDAGRDIIDGGDGPDVVNGGADSDNIEGGDGNDIVNGDAGNDTLNADNDPDGADALNGGPGRDRVDYSARTNPIGITVSPTAAAGPGNDGEFCPTAPLGETCESDNVAEVERIDGGDGGDVIDASAYNTADAPRVFLFGFAGADTLTGGNANDQLYGGTNPTDTTDELNGGPGNDRLDGGTGNDIENGGTGNDTFVQGTANNGADDLNGGANADGNDTVKYRGRSTPVILTLGGTGGQGGTEGDSYTDIERAIGGSAADQLTGDGTDNILLGQGGNDTLKGLAGDDILKGGSGADTLEGGAGDDELFGQSGRDRLDGGGGTDFGNGGTGSDKQCASLETKKSCP